MLNYAKARSFLTAFGMAFLALVMAPTIFLQTVYHRKIRENTLGRFFGNREFSSYP